MRNWKKSLVIWQGVILGLCALDGVATILGAPMTETNLNMLLGNGLSALFFLPAALALYHSWQEWDEAPVRLVRLVSFIALAGSLLVQLLMYASLLLDLGPIADKLLLGLWILLNLPTINCSIMFLPIFAWALLLIGSNTMLRKMHKR